MLLNAILSYISLIMFCFINNAAILTTCITVHLQIEEISRRLRTGDLGIPPNPEDRFETKAIRDGSNCISLLPDSRPRLPPLQCYFIVMPSHFLHTDLLNHSPFFRENFMNKLIKILQANPISFVYYFVLLSFSFVIIFFMFLFLLFCHKKSHMTFLEECLRPSSTFFPHLKLKLISLSHRQQIAIMTL